MRMFQKGFKIKKNNETTRFFGKEIYRIPSQREMTSCILMSNGSVGMASTH